MINLSIRPIMECGKEIIIMLEMTLSEDTKKGI